MQQNFATDLCGREFSCAHANRYHRGVRTCRGNGMAHALEINTIGKVVTIAIHRPDVHNAFDDALVAELTDALAKFERDADVRAVVLTGTGSTFSAGADLNWMRGMAKASE